MRIDWADHELRSAEAVQKVLRTSGTEVSERTEKIVAEKLQEFKGKISDEMMEVVNDDMKGYRDIEQIIDHLSKEQLVLLLAEIKRLALNSPAVARAFLEAHPQVKVAALCALSRVSVSAESFQAPSAQELAIARQKARVILPGRQTTAAVVSNPL